MSKGGQQLCVRWIDRGITCWILGLLPQPRSQAAKSATFGDQQSIDLLLRPDPLNPSLATKLCFASVWCHCQYSLALKASRLSGLMVLNMPYICVDPIRCSLCTHLLEGFLSIKQPKYSGASLDVGYKQLSN